MGNVHPLLYIPSYVFILLLITQLSYGQNIITGTGFYINENGDVLTNRHVVENCKKESIYFIDYYKEKHKSKILAISEEYDIAAIRTGSKAKYIGALAVHPGSTDPVMMNTDWDVFSFGYSQGGEEQFFARGIALENDKYNDFPFIGAAELNVTSGASGSALIDKSALVLGIVFARVGADYFNPDQQWNEKNNLIMYYNLNAILHFTNKHDIYIRYDYRNNYQAIPFIILHAERVTGKIVCEEK